MVNRNAKIRCRGSDARALTNARSGFCAYGHQLVRPLCHTFPPFGQSSLSVQLRRSRPPSASVNSSRLLWVGSLSPLARPTSALPQVEPCCIAPAATHPRPAPLFGSSRVGAGNRGNSSIADTAMARSSVRRVLYSGDFRHEMRLAIRNARKSKSVHIESKDRTMAGTGGRFRASLRARIEGGSGEWTPVTDPTADLIAGMAARQSTPAATSARRSMARQSRRTCSSSSGVACSTTSLSQPTAINSTPSFRSGAGNPLSGKPPTFRNVSRMVEPGLSSRSCCSMSAATR